MLDRRFPALLFAAVLISAPPAQAADLSGIAEVIEALFSALPATQLKQIEDRDADAAPTATSQT